MDKMNFSGNEASIVGSCDVAGKRRDMPELFEGERIDDTGFGGRMLIQKPEDFCYGIDAVLLADFAAKRRKGREKPATVVDLGTGTGVIPIILDYKICPEKIYGIEFQRDSWERACRNADANGLEERISFINDDVGNFGDLECEWGRKLKGKADMVVSNPPYFQRGSGLTNDKTPKMLARHETSAGLGEFMACASHLLKPKGEFFMIHRPFRLADICCFGRENGLEPKEIRFISPKKDAEPNMLLVHMIKGGGSELKFPSNIWVYDDEGKYTPEILKAYER